MSLQKRIEPALDLEMNESALAKAPSEEIDIKSRILTVRGVQVMIDRDLAQLYGVDVKRLNEQVKRNAERFPSDFMFQLSKEESRARVPSATPGGFALSDWPVERASAGG